MTNDNAMLFALLSAFLVSIVAFSGIIFLAFKQQMLRKIIFVLVSFAVGALFGNAFFILIPESFHLLNDTLFAGILIIAGILSMFILEKFIHWKHDHDISEIKKEAPLGYISLATDALHNFIDGVLIAAAWATSPEIGIATTLAVIIHEVPQEISDFGILIHAGFSRKKALLFNFLSALTAIVGVLLAFWVGQRFENISYYILPVAAGGFIYLAGSDLIPELHREKSTRKNLLQFVAIIAGLLLMLFISQNLEHNHGHDHNHTCEDPTHQH
jgi:zinc and cadmium transporter